MATEYLWSHPVGDSAAVDRGGIKERLCTTADIFAAWMACSASPTWPDLSLDVTIDVRFYGMPLTDKYALDQSLVRAWTMGRSFKLFTTTRRMIFHG